MTNITIETEHILFEIVDIFDKKIRTTKQYWEKIKTEKHQELSATPIDVISTLQTPDEVYLSLQDAYIRLFYKIFNEKTLVVLVKYIDDTGFVVTCYETSKIKRKGEKIWPK